MVDRVKAITGRIDLVHCNNSRDEFGSGRDRHAGLESGQIDPALLVDVVRVGRRDRHLRDAGRGSGRSLAARQAQLAEPLQRPATGLLQEQRRPHCPLREHLFGRERRSQQER